MHMREKDKTKDKESTEREIDQQIHTHFLGLLKLLSPAMPMRLNKVYKSNIVDTEGWGVDGRGCGGTNKSYW